MSTYIVAFEVKSSKHKNKLENKLKEYESYCPINDTCWAIVSENTPVQIRDNLKKSLESLDRIFVIRSGTSSAWRNSYGDKHSEWLKENL